MKASRKIDEDFWKNIPITPAHPKFKPNIFKQFFCNHSFENFQHENGWASFPMCSKCGKHRLNK